MPFSPETIAIKPYNQCIKCEYLGLKCDGPNVIAMSKERFCEWVKQRKQELGWSAVKLAEVSEVSKATVDRILSGSITGLNSETMRTITCALIYGYSCPDDNWGKYPCAMAAMAREGECAGCSSLRQQMQKQAEDDRAKIDFLKKQISFKEDQMLAKDKQLEARSGFLRRKDLAITVLSVLLGIAILLIIAALAADALIPDLGFFWMDR